MNVELLRRVQAQILAEPKHFDMGWWEVQQPCGTVRCIGGWIIALSGFDVPSYGGVATLATRLLDAGDDSLFNVFNWPAEWGQKYDAADDDPVQAAKVASDYIDYWIETYKEPGEHDE